MSNAAHKKIRVYRSEHAANVARAHLEKRGNHVVMTTGAFWVLRVVKTKKSA